MKNLAAASLLALMLVGCATATSTQSNDGWTSAPGAPPIESANQQCRERTDSNSGPGFDECMAGLGWTHAAH